MGGAWLSGGFCSFPTPFYSWIVEYELDKGHMMRQNGPGKQEKYLPLWVHFRHPYKQSLYLLVTDPLEYMTCLPLQGQIFYLDVVAGLI